jgi:hypothetical protein
MISENSLAKARMVTGMHFLHFSASQIDDCDERADYGDDKSVKSVCLSPTTTQKVIKIR